MGGDAGGRAALIGRERELADLGGALERTLGGTGDVCLLVGEPGIGKSRLCSELATAAADRGARVLWGRAWEGPGAPAYWPWIQVLRAYVLGSDPDVLSVRLGRGAPYVAQLVPEIETGGVGAVHESLDPEQARFQLFEAVTALLVAASRDRPLVVVLDDLHWADHPSILLLRFLAAEAPRNPLLILGAFRETEASAEPQTRSLLAEVARHGRRLPLSGLAPDEVRRFIARVFDVDVTDRAAHAIHTVTEGNPFFVDEVVRVLVAEGRIADPSAGLPTVPSGIRETIRRRFAPLPEPAHDVLSTASVIGRSFSLPMLERVSALPRPVLLDALSAAADAGILIGSAASLGSYRFSHALVRETLYEDLGPARRAELHRRAGEALEATYGPDAESRLTELAHHFLQAAPGGGDEGKAVWYAMRAAERAVAQFAFEEASGHYRRALEALELGAGDGPTRCTLLLAYGDALWRAGEGTLARDQFASAGALARRLDDPLSFARAALGYGLGLGGEGFTFRADERLVALLEEAADLLGDRDDALRARLLARLAVELYWTDRLERRVALSSEALAIAEALGDPTLRLVTLYSRNWALMSPETLDERLAAGEEMARLADEVGDAEMSYWGHHFRATTMLERGDVKAFEAALDRCVRIADELAMPLYRWQMATWRAGRALTGGRLDEAEQLGAEAYALGERGLHEAASFVLGAQATVAASFRGRFADLEPAIRGFADQYPWVVAWRAGLAGFNAEIGNAEAARAALVPLVASGPAGLPRDASWLGTMWNLALCCWVVREPATAVWLYDALAPYAAHVIVIGAIAMDFGSVEFPLALLAATTGRFEEADEHFRRAIEMDDALGNVLMTVMTYREQAAALVARGGTPARERAARILDQAMSLMREHGLDGTLVRARTIAADLGRTAVVLEPEDGGLWRVSFGGRDARLGGSIGLGYLRELVGESGRERHVLDLATVSEPGDAARLRAAKDAGLAAGRPGDAGPMLDARAKAQIRLRLEDLRAEAEEARSWGDDERAARAEEEIEAIAGELARSIGLGGRDRRASSASERARINVTRAIRTAIDRIASVHPELADHLRAAIRTGTFCRYEP